MQRMLIDGKLVAAEADRTYPSVNPATGQVIDHAPDASAADARGRRSPPPGARSTPPAGRPTPRSAPAAWTSCTRR